MMMLKNVTCPKTIFGKPYEGIIQKKDTHALDFDVTMPFGLLRVAIACLPVRHNLLSKTF